MQLPSQCCSPLQGCVLIHQKSVALLHGMILQSYVLQASPGVMMVGILITGLVLSRLV